jgi:hypothetical protein
MSWWDFLALLFGPFHRTASRRRNVSPPEDTWRLRRARAWRWMRATG